MLERRKGIICPGKCFSYFDVRFCARYILANIKTEVKQGIIPRDLCWECVRSTSVFKHKQTMLNMKRNNPLVHVYLGNIPKNQWERNTFNTKVKANHATNNMAETWNNSLGVIKGQPIITMFEGICRKVMTTLAKRMFEGQRIIAPAPPILYEKVDKALPIASKMNKKHSSDWIY